MNSQIRSKNYEHIPVIYDYIMRFVKYGDWASYLHEITKKYLPKKPSVLELAAGNCKFANAFRKYYPNLIVSDLSFNMLKYDKKNLVPKICADMTELPFKFNFNLVYSTFDSVNYLTSKKKLIQMFKEVRNVLTSEGIFTFDVGMEKNSINHSKVLIRRGEHKGITFEQRSEYSKVSRLHKNSFKITKNGTTITEIHREKIYAFEDYFKMIDKAGLYTIDCLNAFTYDAAKKNSPRIQFILGKAD